MNQRISYQGIAEAIRADIDRGAFDGYAVFPTPQDLDHLGARGTVVRAFGVLVAEGLIRHANNGRYEVIPAAIRGKVWPVSGRYRSARERAGLIFEGDTDEPMSKRTLGREWIEPPDEIRDLLQIEPDALVLHRQSETEVAGVVLERTSMFFPKAVVNDAPALDEDEDIRVVELIEGTGRTIATTRNTIRYRAATEDEAKALDLVAATILAVHTHGTYTTEGEPVEAVVNIRPAAGFNISFTTDERPEQ